MPLPKNTGEPSETRAKNMIDLLANAGVSERQPSSDYKSMLPTRVVKATHLLIANDSINFAQINPEKPDDTYAYGLSQDPKRHATFSGRPWGKTGYTFSFGGSSGALNYICANPDTVKETDVGESIHGIAVEIPDQYRKYFEGRTTETVFISKELMAYFDELTATLKRTRIIPQDATVDSLITAAYSKAKPEQRE